VAAALSIPIPLERQDEERTILKLVRRGHRIEHYEIVRRRKDGSLVDISLTVSPVRSGAGEIVGASKIAH
jgi:PAS domain S-box-containing protein